MTSFFSCVEHDAPGLALILAVFLNDFEAGAFAVMRVECAVQPTQAKERMPSALRLDRPSVKDDHGSSLPELRDSTSTSTVDFVDSTIRIVREHPPPTTDLLIQLDLLCATNEGPRHSRMHNIDVVQIVREAGGGELLRAGRRADLGRCRSILREKRSIGARQRSGQRI